MMLKKGWVHQIPYALWGIVAGSFVGQGEAFTKQEEVVPWVSPRHIFKLEGHSAANNSLSLKKKQWFLNTCENLMDTRFDSMKAAFVQTTFTPSRPPVRTSGEMFIQRPGKLRLNYRPEPGTGERIELLSDGKTICQYRLNASRTEVLDSSSADLFDTPLGFILQKGSMRTHAIIEDVYQTPKGKHMYTMIRLRNRQDPEAGVVTLVLSQPLEQHRRALPTIRFWGWILRDAQGTRVEVHLTKIDAYVKILPATFKIPGKN